MEQAQEQTETDAAFSSPDELLTRMAHDVRTPLSTMLIWVGVLRSTRAPDRESALAAIEESARSLSHVIDELLDAAQYIRGELSIARETVDLSVVVANAVAAFGNAASSRSIGLVVDVHPRPVLVVGDAVHLGKVVRRLVSNAVRFSPDGGRVQVRLTRKNGHARIEVTDSGPGLPPEILHRLSGPSATPHKEPSGKLGLGLFLARRIVHLHGGALRAAHRAAEPGAVVSVMLPVVPRIRRSPSTGPGERLLNDSKVNRPMTHRLTGK